MQSKYHLLQRGRATSSGILVSTTTLTIGRQYVLSNFLHIGSATRGTLLQPNSPVVSGGCDISMLEDREQHTATGSNEYSSPHLCDKNKNIDNRHCSTGKRQREHEAGEISRGREEERGDDERKVKEEEKEQRHSKPYRRPSSTCKCS